MKVQESAENYLETILVLSKRNGSVRSIDIVKELGFTKPSISVAMKNLRQNNYIIMDEEGYIKLTSDGLKIASKVYERHIIISKVLVKLGVCEKQAAEDACRIEHVISEESFEAIKKVAAKMNK
ncbi:metal-dependent transcriptional regulator [Clostridium sp.]|jgi:Mn-dependent DtxR family transcriptional regulator|uniref:metal-dependent transcriptional regulator n=1 Tax=Clostridium sp. TaxID=1506 RepID=UPI002FDF0237